MEFRDRFAQAGSLWKELDPVAKLLGVFDIQGGDVPDALDMDRAEIDRAAEGDGLPSRTD